MAPISQALRERLGEALAHGPRLRLAVLLEDSPGTFAAFRARAISEWMDFDDTIAPHRARFLQRLEKGGA